MFNVSRPSMPGCVVRLVDKRFVDKYETITHNKAERTKNKKTSAYSPLSRLILQVATSFRCLLTATVLHKYPSPRLQLRFRLEMRSAVVRVKSTTCPMFLML